MRGIYVITNTLTETVYYGQSTDIKRRLEQHKRSLMRGTHHNSYLQASWDKYGEAAFIFVPLEIIEDKTIDLTPIEWEFIREGYDKGLNLFNMDDPKDPSKWTIARRAKSSASLKGHSVSDETRKKISEANIGNQKWFGRKHSDETKKKMSEAKQGTKPRLGAVLSNETKNKISISVKKYFELKKAAKVAE